MRYVTPSTAMLSCTQPVLYVPRFSKPYIHTRWLVAELVLSTLKLVCPLSATVTVNALLLSPFFTLIMLCVLPSP